ncbi:unnamed protein product, partial [Ectocarpus sp. 6 AP-2014]
MMITASDHLRRTYRQCARSAAGCVVCRWVLFAASAAVFILRVYTERRWYLVAYSVGILFLNNTVQFLTPQVGPDAERLRGLSERRRHRFSSNERLDVYHRRSHTVVDG